MKKAMGMVAALALLLPAGSVMAEPAFGSAGCGLGSMVLGPGYGFSQIFAATTNGIFWSQGFGITFGTSNCADPGGGAKSAKAFIESNRNALATDMSRGSGETITNFAALMGCSDPKAVGSSLQKNFKQIFPTDSVSSEAVTKSVFSTLKTENVTCSKLD